MAPPMPGRHAERDRALLRFLYNSGARVQEVVELRWRDLDLAPPTRVRLIQAVSIESPCRCA